MRSGEVIEPLPLFEFGFQIHVAFVAEQLVEFLLVRPVGAFDFSIQLRRAPFDVGVADALVFDMLMEFGLELMAVVGSDLADPKWEILDDVIDEVYGAGLGLLLVDF